MPVFLLFVGAILLIVAIRGNYAALGSQIGKDLTGSGNFLIWVGGLAIVGMLGYIKGFETPSRAFLGLIILSMLIANSGFFANFASALQNVGTTPASPANPGQASLQGAAPFDLAGLASGGALNVKVQGAQSGGLGGIVSSAAGAVTKAAGV